MADKYGPIFTVKMGFYQTSVVSNWKNAKECFSGINDKVFANRPKTLAVVILSYNFSLFGLASYGPYWRQCRKIATVELLSNNRLEKLKHVRETEMETSMKELHNKISSNNKVSVEMKRWFGDITLNVILRIIIGKRWSSTSQEDGWKDELKKFFEMFGENLILAAIDTASVTLTWALTLLLNHRNVLKKLQNELDIHVGSKRKVKELDLKNLVYLQAILKEALRMYPAGPLSVPHESSEDCTISGYHVPVGTRLLVNLWKIHRDPCVWSEPLGGECALGVSFALQVAQLTLASLFHGFDLENPFDEAVDTREGMGMTINKVSPLHVLLSPRLSASVYGGQL
ncbi:hypothetical protein Dsin_005018 [Dipteronia sinensis]|uniref:Cytochrome P450 n=1 Tax=Dipteronia sinensis TaxID=43782 RepID=A0AAE0EEA8_9ROSI|nr:hypothetical protein Dsin_005018 [Dipteronia sinensis]